MRNRPPELYRHLRYKKRVEGARPGGDRASQLYGIIACGPTGEDRNNTLVQPRLHQAAKSAAG